jgi:hypothetical protein
MSISTAPRAAPSTFCSARRPVSPKIYATRFSRSCQHGSPTKIIKRAPGCKIDDTDADHLGFARSRHCPRSWAYLGTLPHCQTALLYFRAVRQSHARDLWLPGRRWRQDREPRALAARSAWPPGSPVMAQYTFGRSVCYASTRYSCTFSIAVFRASAWSAGLAGGHGGGRICLREGATTHLG